MTLQLASLASFLLVATSLTVFGLALRKVSQMMRHARGLVEAVNACSADLDRALAMLKTERQTCEQLEASLDDQLRDGRKAHSALARTISLAVQARSELSDADPAANGTTAAAAPAKAETQHLPITSERKLPAFVHRTVKSVHAAQKLG